MRAVRRDTLSPPTAIRAALCVAIPVRQLCRRHKGFHGSCVSVISEASPAVLGLTECHNELLLSVRDGLARLNAAHHSRQTQLDWKMSLAHRRPEPYPSAFQGHGMTALVYHREIEVRAGSQPTAPKRAHGLRADQARPHRQAAQNRPFTNPSHRRRSGVEALPCLEDDSSPMPWMG